MYQMYRVYRLLPGGSRQPGLPGSQASGTGRGTPAFEEIQFL